MNKLIKKISLLKQSKIKNIIESRVKEFKTLAQKGNREWFSELCFCILTANSSAKLGINIQNEIKEGFLNLERHDLEKKLRNIGHRFWKKRAEFITEARKFKNIKDILMKVEDKREWLVKNIKGIGMKEASHFLRNVGFLDYAIIDRHILSILNEYGYISMPKILTKKKYLEIENVLMNISRKVGLKLGILDLYLWYMKTGMVLK